MPTSLTNAQLADKLSTVSDGFYKFVSEIRAWLTTTPTGGPTSNGYVPLSDYAISTSIPSLQKLAGLMQKGDPARQDISIGLQGRVGAGERLPSIPMVAAATFDAATSTIIADGAPAAGDWTIKFWKNLSTSHPANTYPATTPWATATIPSGQNAGSIAFTGTGTLAQGDRLTAFANPTYDPAVTNVTVVLAGA